MIALGYLKQVIYILFQLFVFIEKISYALYSDHAFSLPQLLPNPPLLATHQKKTKPRKYTHNRTTKTQAKVDKQKTNKTINAPTKYNETKVDKNTIEFFLWWPSTRGRGPLS